MTDPRRFSMLQHVALYLASGGRCTDCGTELLPGWHADHRTPYSRGGATDVVNGQALCPACNLKKGSKTTMTDRPLRDWQERALEELSKNNPDPLVMACPGAGKTTLALEEARRRFIDREIARIIIVTNSCHLTTQWAGAAAVYGLNIRDEFENRFLALASDDHGVAVHYSTVANAPELWRKLSTEKLTLVVLDEIHHAGTADNLRWGRALQRAFGPSARRLLLSGTPFRTDGQPIPFVSYGVDGRAETSFSYSYGEAIADGVVRPIEFLGLDGNAEWKRNSLPDSATLSEAAEDQIPGALRATFDPHGSWITSALRRADEELTRQRVETEMPDAAGLVFASTQEMAKAYAETLRGIAGTSEVVVAVSDDAASDEAIQKFRDGTTRWIVAVRKVSEGVDIPRLAVGVYATTARTEMFFRQVVGRLVRMRGDSDPTIPTMFIPAIEELQGFARTVQNEADAAIKNQIIRETEDLERGSGGLFDVYEAVASSDSTIHSAIRTGEQYLRTELDRARELRAGLSLMGSDSAVAELLRRAGHVAAPQAPHSPSVSQKDRKEGRRRLLNKEVRAYAASTETPHGQIWKELYKPHGLGNLRQASVEQLDEMTARIHSWWPA